MARGIEPTIFEVGSHIGGLWVYENDSGLSPAYRSLHIDTSKERLSFKDFPIPEHFPSFPHHSDIKAYLDAYADAFGLLENIEFTNGVQHAVKKCAKQQPQAAAVFMVIELQQVHDQVAVQGNLRGETPLDKGVPVRVQSERRAEQQQYH